MELIREDVETSVQLWAEHRRAPGGELDTLYRFKADPPRGLPSHLAPADPMDRAAAIVAFERIVEWCKGNPQG